MFLMKTAKKQLCIALSFFVILSTIFVAFTGQKAYAAGTGQGLADWAISKIGCAYVYGAAGPYAFDCSGLIFSYAGGPHNSEAMIAEAPEKGPISTMPKIPGIGLYMYGHVGVYIGGDTVVEALNEECGVISSSSVSGKWEQWFKVAGVDYSSSGSGEGTGGNTGEGTGGNTGEGTGGNTGEGTGGNTGEGTGGNTEGNTPAEEPTYMGRGSTGDDVRSVQTRLGELKWYDGTDSGYFGEYTEYCLKCFQEAVGIEQTGVLDPDTLLWLFDDAYNPPVYKPLELKSEMSGEEVKTAQERLNKLEYLSSEDVSGYFGGNTTKAVCDFQEASGLPVTGVIDKATSDALYSESAELNPNAPLLQIGATGEEVNLFQTQIKLLRYDTVEIKFGEYDKATEKVVREFQKVNGLEETGILTRKTKEILFSEKALQSLEANDLQEGFMGDDVKDLQEKLVMLSLLENSDITGYYDEKTAAAVEAFKSSKGLTSTDGVATMAIRAAIEAEIQSLNGYAQTSNDKVSSLTSNSLAPAKQDGANIVVGVIFALIGMLLIVAAVIKIKFPHIQLSDIKKLKDMKNLSYIKKFGKIKYNFKNLNLHM